MKAKTLLTLVALAMVGTWALAGCRVVEQEADQEPTASPTLEPAVTPLPLTPTVLPATPFVTPAATPKPTPTPQPGVCPEPNRRTLADFATPPPAPSAESISGQRVQGGTPYSEAHVTLHLPAGREFAILSAWSPAASNLVIDIYDLQTVSGLTLRGDGCEIGRFVRDSAADAAFDEIMSSLEIGAKYVCPAPIREVVSPPTVESAQPVVQGGGPAQLGPLTLHLPAGREFKLGPPVPSDPGGTSYGVYDVQTRSGVWFRPDGCEIGRRVSDPAADPVFDEILTTLEAPSR